MLSSHFTLRSGIVILSIITTHQCLATLFSTRSGRQDMKLVPTLKSDLDEVVIVCGCVSFSPARHGCGHMAAVLKTTYRSIHRAPI